MASLPIPFKALILAALWILFVVSLGRNSGGFLSIIPLVQIQDPIDHCSKLGFVNKTISDYHQSDELEYGRHGSCRSRIEQHCFWDQSKYAVSRPFVAALRDYEEIHRRCSGEAVEQFFSNQTSKNGCKYVVWRSPRSGLGNKIISLASVFVYSLLTNRTLLISTEGGISDLFCEPFRNSSWILPPDFPLQVLMDGKRGSEFYAEMLQRLNGKDGSMQKRKKGSIRWVDLDLKQRPKSLGIVSASFPYMKAEDLRFFCPAEQDLIDNISWLYWDSSNYMAPGLYFVPRFRLALNRLFPDHAVFLHVARFLFSPKDEPWHHITHYYTTHLSSSRRRRTLGIQIRAWKSEYHPILSARATKCATNISMLPQPLAHQHFLHPLETNNGSIENKHEETWAILVASLRGEYYKNISDAFTQHPREGGHRVEVYTTSSESKQKTGDHEHDVKAVTDIWLLSFMDDLITSAQSTFGDVAHGLAGINPLVFTEPRNIKIDENTMPDPPCKRANIQGPCFQNHPLHMACPLDSRGGVEDPYHMVPEVRHCELQVGIGITQKHT